MANPNNANTTDTTKGATGTQARYWPWFPAALALSGVILFIFVTHGPPASSSGFVSALKGGIGQIAPDYVRNNPHYRMLPGPGSWLMAFVVGMAAGGFLAGRRMRGQPDDVPAIWRERIGGGAAKRYGVAFCGGFLILFAARLAGGCTLGLFMSGSIQLAVSGLYFGVVIFACAMLTARIVYGKGGKENA
ncbi:MAG: YeeE/YedE thiosulfate transporter family protein [Planctomycetota bacterium]